jgi:hypothetical protein
MGSERRRRSRVLRATSGTLVGLAFLCLAGAAHAEPSAAQKQLARELMQRGHERRDAGDPKSALEAFQAADQIMGVPTTGFEVARSQADLGQLVEAHETLLHVLRIPSQPDDPQVFRDARSWAATLDNDLAQRIPSVRIHLEGAPPSSQPSVSVDGVAIPAAALAVPYELDPGHHVIAASVGAVRSEVAVDVAERDRRDVTLRLVVGDGAAGAAPPAPPFPAAPGPSMAPATPESAAAPARKGGIPTLAWIGFGIAGAGIAVGSVTGVMSLSDKGSIQKQCFGNRCPPSTFDSIDSANTLATVSTISFIVAGAGAALGVTSFLLRGSDDAPPSQAGSVRVSPWVGPGALGARGTF